MSKSDSSNSMSSSSSGSSSTQQSELKENNRAQSQLQDNLVTACENGDIKAVEESIERGAQPLLLDSKGKCPFLAAVRGMNPNVMDKLLNCTNGMTPYFWEEYVEHNKKKYRGIFLVEFEDTENIQTHGGYYTVLRKINESPFLREWYYSPQMGGWGSIERVETIIRGGPDVWITNPRDQQNREKEYKLIHIKFSELRGSIEQRINAARRLRPMDEEIQQALQRAEQGDKNAQYFIGWCYTHKFIGAENEAKFNEEKAIGYYRKAADQGHMIAQYFVGFSCENTGDEKATAWYRQSAEQGYKRAQYALGVHCENRANLEQYEEKVKDSEEAKEAFEWFVKSADQGYKEARCALGVCYEKGIGTIQNRIKAISLYHESANQGYLEAQYRLGLWYHFDSRDQDEKEAVVWYRKAAEQGHLDAQYYLGNCYASGKGIDLDEKKAVEWYVKAANQGHQRSQYNLGHRYANGKGVDRDQKLAVGWYRKGIDQGAYYELCLMSGNVKPEEGKIYFRKKGDLLEYIVLRPHTKKPVKSKITEVEFQAECTQSIPEPLDISRLKLVTRDFKNHI